MSPTIAHITHHHKKPSISLTPLIDVVFILLIFFMLIMQFKQFSQFPIDLAKAQYAPLVTKPLAIDVYPKAMCKTQQTFVSCAKLIRQIDFKQHSVIVLGYHPETEIQQILNAHKLFKDTGLVVKLLPDNVYAETNAESNHAH